MLEAALRLVLPRTRPVRVPAGIRTVTVGGATIGGSGKTRVAIAIAKDLARRGERVALVGHAYRARPSFARVVRPDDAVARVGDEALVCARALHGVATVVVAPSRQDAVLHAARIADVLVFDGPLQLRPMRASLSVLAMDALDPLPHRSLLAHADVVVPVDSRPAEEDLAALRGRRFGLFTAIARPHRLVDALRRAGASPARIVEVSDHGPAPASARRILAAAEVELWAATPKCAVHLEGVQVSASLRVLTCIDPPRASDLTLRSTP